VSARYVVHCPDALSFRIDGRPDWGGDRIVGADGRVWLAPGVSVRVDGLTVPQIAARASRQLDLLPECVEVNVAAFNSQQIYLFGEVSGLQQAVPYQGPETVLELLQRAGGVTTGAAPRDVQVVRSHVADGKPPEVFQVDLAAIVLQHEQGSNITLQPFDKIYIGQNRQCKLSRCLPPWLRTLYEECWDMRRPGARRAD
jgi:polysaccharide export outer membrane protein